MKGAEYCGPYLALTPRGLFMSLKLSTCSSVLSEMGQNA